MDEFEVGLERASQSLAQFVDGPGVSAARALEEAFSTAGQNIEQVLKQAAQSGELDFQRMTRTILADLARILTEALLAQSGLNQVGQTFNLNMAFNDGARSNSGLSSAGSIATLIAAAAARGARYA
ncbi:MAG: phage tail tape measure C-terminal domain-containing protein [Pseudomonadota bacterium]